MSSLHCLHYWLAEIQRLVARFLAQTSWESTKYYGYNFQRPVRKVAPVPTISKFPFDHHTHQDRNIHTLLTNVLSITWSPIWIRLLYRYPNCCQFIEVDIWRFAHIYYCYFDTSAEHTHTKGGHFLLLDFLTEGRLCKKIDWRKLKSYPRAPRSFFFTPPAQKTQSAGKSRIRIPVPPQRSSQSTSPNRASQVNPNDSRTAVNPLTGRTISFYY